MKHPRPVTCISKSREGLGDKADTQRVRAEPVEPRDRCSLSRRRSLALPMMMAFIDLEGRHRRGAPRYDFGSKTGPYT